VARSLGLAMLPGQSSLLSAYLDLLSHWNKTYNLSAVRAREDMAVQHVADCLAIVEPLSRRLPTGRVLDVGAGGGLPSVVLAIMRPELEVTALDAVGKKCAFVRQVASALALGNLKILHGRVEQLKAPAYDLIVSRAFASLADFVRLTGPCLAPPGLWLAMKGKTPDAEIQSLPREVEVFHVEPLSVPRLHADRCLVWIRRRQQPVTATPEN
jgi:16S rRNA (guanine527-N7)-methyltransferase